MVEEAAALSPACVRRASAMRERLLIFGIALVLRATAGALFFGSVDLVNSALNSIALSAGKTVALPYFPTINALIWLGGVLAAYTPLPLPLCLKLVPILFDSLMAVLIFDLVAPTAPRFANRAGLLYALNPIALLINSFHGQWDSIALFFLLLAFAVREVGEKRGASEFLFGAIFSCSLLIKPIALPFVLLLPRRKGEAAKLEWAAAAGAASVLLAALSVYAACRYSLIDLLIGITSYSAKGIQVFGLPFAPGLARLSIQGDRLAWLIPAMLALAVLYHRRKLAAIDAMLLFYLCTLATTGLSPQYLLWPVPLLLVSRRLGLAAIYTGVATLFLLFYYMNPWSSYFAFENLATFAPLRGLAWLLPPAFMAGQSLLPWVHALGNVVLPACAAILVCLVFRSRTESDTEGAWPIRKTAWYTSPVLIVGVAALALKVITAEQYVRTRLIEIWNAMPDYYALHIQWANGNRYFVGDFGSFSPFNLALLLAVLAAIWCTAAAANDR